MPVGSLLRTTRILETDRQGLKGRWVTLHKYNSKYILAIVQNPLLLFETERITNMYVISPSLYTYMVIDLKVLVKSFNCEDRSCYAGNPRESFFLRVRESFFYSRKVDIMKIIIIVYITVC